MKYWQSAIKIPFVNFAFGISCLQILFLNLAIAQNFTLPPHKTKGTIKFETVKNLVIIPLYINGKGPYNFILDTGVGLMIITDSTLMDTLGIKSYRTTKIYGLGQGQEVEAHLSSDVQVNIQDATIKNMPTAILKKDIFNLSNYLGKKIHGLIGYYFFSSFLVKLNYTVGKVTFYTPNTKVRKPGIKFPIEIENRRPFITVDLQTAQKENIKAKLIIDIGASHALSMEALNGKAFPLPDSTIAGNLGIGLSGLIDGRVGRLPALSLGKFKFKNIITNFPSFESVASQIGYNTRNGNLGADLLRRFDMTIDYGNSSLYLRPNKNFREPYEHDMSGMELYSDYDNHKRYFVGRVEPGSPAEKAGILEQDEIIAVDFKLADFYTLESLSNLLKSVNGKTLVVEVIRKNKNIIKLVKLKRRI